MLSERGAAGALTSNSSSRRAPMLLMRGDVLWGPSRGIIISVVLASSARGISSSSFFALCAASTWRQSSGLAAPFARCICTSTVDSTWAASRRSTGFASGACSFLAGIVANLNLRRPISSATSRVNNNCGRPNISRLFHHLRVDGLARALYRNGRLGVVATFKICCIHPNSVSLRNFGAFS